MDINKNYRLEGNSYFNKKHIKKQIVIGNTFNKGLLHYDLWRNKINGKYKGTSPYTITLDGTIYEHYDPKYYSSFLSDDKINKKIISIVLENEGWVGRDFNKNQFIMWNGDIYNRDDELIEYKWRGKNRWAPHSNEQMDSLINLCNFLISDFKISNKVAINNLLIDDVENMEGIFFKSNYSKNYLDISPSFDIKFLKEKLKNEN